MKLILYALLLLLSTTALADDRETTFNSGIELENWCHQNSKFQLHTEQLEVSGWIASNQFKVNSLIIEGQWKQEKSDGVIKVRCAALKGSQKKFGLLEISGKEIKVYTKRSEAKITTREELNNWCKNRSAKLHFKKGEIPHNWTYRHWNQAGSLHIRGEWRVNTDSFTVHCRVRKGWEEDSATLELL